MRYNEPLRPEKFYHIFNHAVGDENLFRNTDNYNYFLKRYTDLIFPVVSTYAYCLLPNHFHFLIQIRRQEELKKAFSEKYAERDLLPNFSQEEFVMQCFSNLFNSYAKAYNKRYARKGALLMDYMRRKEIANDKYFENVAHYIHYNPVHHGLCTNINDWQYSSYSSIIINKKTLLMREDVLVRFNGPNNYIKQHMLLPDEKIIDEMEFA